MKSTKPSDVARLQRMIRLWRGSYAKSKNQLHIPTGAQEELASLSAKERDPLTYAGLPVESWDDVQRLLTDVGFVQNGDYWNAPDGWANIAIVNLAIEMLMENGFNNWSLERVNIPKSGQSHLYSLVQRTEAFGVKLVPNGYKETDNLSTLHKALAFIDMLIDVGFELTGDEAYYLVFEKVDHVAHA